MPPSAQEKNLLDAIRRGDATELEKLLLDGVSPDLKDDSGSTPLHIATRLNSPEAVELLLKYGADATLGDSAGQTPLHYAAREDLSSIIDLLIRPKSDAETDQNTLQATLTPKFPITINGNTLDDSVEPAAEASWTNYVLIQSEKRLTPPQKQELAKVDFVIHEHVSKNTYLGGYQADDLDRLRQIDFILYADVYRVEFKIPPSVKAASLSFPYSVDVVFHEATNPEDFCALIVERSRVGVDDVEFYPHKVRVHLQADYLDALASIDAVRSIEGVGKIVLRNDRARLVLDVSIQPKPGATLHQQYKGQGQTIAIADTGLDSQHPAFAGKVLGMYTFGSAVQDDLDGHGTHVCGSAVGTAIPGTYAHIMGTAPEASLVVQCMGDGKNLHVPGDYTQLFQPPHGVHGARIHSNSWSTECVSQQHAYSQGAREIDEFVRTNPDMLICFAAGNDALAGVKPSQIGAEAAAKNCITVGASENDRTSPVQGDISRVADFSSRGPTKEGRLKPDVVAPGTSVLSANSRHRLNPRYPGPDHYFCYDHGTSMATPLVAGCAINIREALIQKGTTSPSAALIKALLVNGATILSQHTHPNPDSGFGRVNLARSIGTVHGDDGAGFFEGQVDDTSQVSVSNTITASNHHTKLQATLVWSDPWGTNIQNSLLLTVKDATGTEHRGNDDNNVQQVLWDGISSQDLTITVKSLGLTKLSQAFAVAWQFS